MYRENKQLVKTETTDYRNIYKKIDMHVIMLMVQMCSWITTEQMKISSYAFRVSKKCLEAYCRIIPKN